MALIGDIQRVTVIRAQRQKLRMALRNDRHERFQVLGNGPFAHKHMHAFAHLFERFFRTCGLVFGANARRNIAVQIKAAQKRRVAIDMPPLKSSQLRHAFRVFRQNARKIHELRKPDHLGMVRKR